jgi:hypothetical protein
VVSHFPPRPAVSSETPRAKSLRTSSRIILPPPGSARARSWKKPSLSSSSPRRQQPSQVKIEDNAAAASFWTTSQEIVSLILKFQADSDNKYTLVIQMEEKLQHLESLCSHPSSSLHCSDFSFDTVFKAVQDLKKSLK